MILPCWDAAKGHPCKTLRLLLGLQASRLCSKIDALLFFNRVACLRYSMIVSKSWLLYCHVCVTGQEQTQKWHHHRTSLVCSFSPRLHSSLPLFFLWRTSQQSWHLQSVLCACLSPLQRHYVVGLSLPESPLSVAGCVIHC